MDWALCVPIGDAGRRIRRCTPCACVCVLLKFADDTKICSRIRNSDDEQKLQEDLNTLQEWARTWQMKFNIQKCKVMRVGDTDSGLKRVSEYSMGNQKL